jgi:hypothetical protein
VIFLLSNNCHFVVEMIISMFDFHFEIKIWEKEFLKESADAGKKKVTKASDETLENIEMKFQSFKIKLLAILFHSILIVLS